MIESRFFPPSTPPLWALVLLLAIAAVMATTGCAKPPVRPPATYVLTNCKTVEEVRVEDRRTGEKHVELTCTCDHRSEKRDARTNRVIVQCD